MNNGSAYSPQHPPTQSSGSQQCQHQRLLLLSFETGVHLLKFFISPRLIINFHFSFIKKGIYILSDGTSKQQITHITTQN